MLIGLKSEELLFHITDDQPLTFDCFIVQDDPATLMVLKQLYEQGTLFPVVILKANADSSLQHPASIEVEIEDTRHVSYAIDKAIDQFIKLPLAIATKSQGVLRLQRQLAEKFPDKSCYIVGFHKRESQYFYDQMPPVEKQAFWQQLKSDYRQILLSYFTTDTTLKQKIDQFIDTAFNTNIPVPQLIEIHMELIDEFSKQLKLEGRSEEVLLDYRITLIDILAHLCEVYRCSIPK